MRVIAGTAKGTKLFGARGLKIRPILDRIKESLFSLIGEEVRDARVLDLYAGIGNLGIEALSRGASEAVFVEWHRATADAIRENLRRTHLEDRASVLTARLPGGLASIGGSFSLIFADPPFRIDAHSLEVLFHLVHERKMLREEGLLVYRRSPHTHFEPTPDEWRVLAEREYGDSVLCFYAPYGSPVDIGGNDL